MKIVKENNKYHFINKHGLSVMILSRKKTKKLKKQLKKALKPEFEPDWDDAPDWAKWCAVDSDGDVYWYEKSVQQGKVNNKEWNYIDESFRSIYYKYIGPQKNWKNMIYRRPE